MAHVRPLCSTIISSYIERIMCPVLLLLLLCPAVLCVKPRLEIIPAIGELFLGEEKSFICKSNVEAEMKWVNPENGEEMEDENGWFKKDTIDENTQKLTVKALSIKPDRVIRCGAETSDSGETAHVDFRLRILQKVTFVKTETVKEFNAGVSAQLKCLVRGRPTPEVIWFRDNTPVPLSPGHLSATKEGTLTIDNIQLADAGAYRCQASIWDRNETANQIFTVTVNAAPVVRFEESFPNITAKSNASFTCFAVGHPKPEIVWKKGDETVDHDGQKYILSSDGLQLSITDLAKEDEGEYTCYASNRLGEHNTTLILQVLDHQGLGVGLLVGIILLVLLMILLAVDLTCYRTRRRGFLMSICTSVLGRPSSRLEDNDINFFVPTNRL
ncbi:neural cell adhesion molecule 1-like [Gastrophryne carolinensis]